MQSDAVKQLVTSLKRAFPIVTFVERIEDGFDDAVSYAYVRKVSDDGYNYEVDGEWLIGRYVVVAESPEPGLLQKLWNLVDKGCGEIERAGDDAEEIYKDETGIELQRDCNIARIEFTLRTENVCPNC